MLRLNLAVWQFIAAVCLTTTAVAQPVNSALQSAVMRAIGRQHGTVVVLDVHSGRVIASSHLEIAARRVVAPGSSIKPFTLMALLQSGKVTGQTALVCKRFVSVGGRELNCSHPQTSDPLHAAQALAYSCNSYFTTVALRLSPAALQDSFVRDGFSSQTGFASDEVAGDVSVAQSPEQLQLQAVGEWGIRLTPLELVKAYRTLALLRQEHDVKLEPLFAGLEESVSYGMGRMAQPGGPMKVAGKTGTAPSDEGAWTHAWFAGYAPANDPQIALVVFLERGHGGSEAATVARQIFQAFADSYEDQAPARGPQ